jgi:glycosyltransferase involved in cell wall biosynthesis
MKVLISAYACEPGRGSEPGVGWNWALQIGRFHEAWVLTRPCYRGAVSKAMSERPLENIHWVYFDLPEWARWWNKNDTGIHIHYYIWQICAYFVGKKLHREIEFNLAHHVTNACYWMPSFLALLPIPIVWGPVGGGESAPRGFWESFSLYGKVYEILRTLAQGLGRLDPFVRMTARRAAIGLATTAETEVRMRGLGCRNTAILPAIGLHILDRVLLNGFALRWENPFRIVSIGNLLHWKGFDLGLQAFAKIQRQFPDSEYWIIGEGPERKRLETLAHELGVTAKVRFVGAIPRAQVLKKLAQCDVLMHPSLHDSGGWVCLEAMAAGRPVICLALGGPALQVTDDAGIKVIASTTDQAVGELAAAVCRIASNQVLRAHMSDASRRRVEEHFDWDKKGEFLAQIYADLATEECPIAC